MISFRFLLTAFVFYILQQPISFAQQAVVDDEISPNEVSIEMKYEFSLKADYFPGKKKSDAFLILHDCASDRSVYREITEQLVDKQLHVLALDLRGFGKSTSPTFSHKAMKRKAKDIIAYQVELAQITSYWQEDVLVAFEYLRGKLDKQASISILSSGCSAPYAVSVAEKMHIANMVMLTPEMDYAGKERYKNLTDISTYFIASVHHVETYRTAKELFEWNGHTRSKMLSFKGDHVDAQLLKQNKSLASDIAQWLSERAK